VPPPIRSLRCLERFAQLGAPLADWRREAGDGFAAVEPLLKDTDRLASRWSRPGRPAMRIVEHEDGRAVAVCDEEVSDPIELTHADRVLRRPCEHQLRRRLCAALDLHVSNEPLTRLPGLLAIGEWRRNPPASLCAWLAVATSSAHLGQLVTEMATRAVRPTVLLTPTRSMWSAQTDASAAQGRLALVPLDDVLEAQGGSWTRSAAWDAYVANVSPDSAAIGGKRAPIRVNGAPPAGPLVVLGRPGDPCNVRGRPKPALTDGRHAVVAALIEAGDEGLGKDALQAIRPSARRMLEDLQRDDDWASVIVMAKTTNGRYRIRS
jgi:hypothetical protein